ncbi:hypothetical protein Tsubulata_050194 [Turnera subulata]|uniref:Uncharacterized protein n=1 Tax=Turnera subulata TaxID=218843 RepID=A0A9Q0FDD1_9ROSI|nr:hypothetical protein Tsubulata_050194 [Turnera subulata]
MANLPKKGILLQGMRCYTSLVTSETLTQPAVSAAMRKAKDVKAEDFPEKKDNFWMRDPKTGNWIPESHFDEVDVAELRERVLSKKYRS